MVYLHSLSAHSFGIPFIAAYKSSPMGASPSNPLPAEASYTSCPRTNVRATLPEIVRPSYGVSLFLKLSDSFVTCPQASRQLHGTRAAHRAEHSP